MHCLVLPLMALAHAAAPFTPPAPPSFARDVAPLLRTHCLRCHAGPRPKGDLDLTSRAGLLAQGGNGAAVVPGKALASPLYLHVRDGKMPPRAPLGAASAELLRRWIDAGAAWDGPAPRPVAVAAAQRAGADWWALQPIRRDRTPEPRGVAARTAIDVFLLAELTKRGLSFSPEADRLTLIRRLTVDLTGLAPTPDEIDAFLSDRRPDAYERLVDKLLASPAYGERSGRHWLDVVRFAESHGYETNVLRRSAWPYRDWVIRAFNSDLAYRDFVAQQLAADALPAGDLLTQAATGFLVAGPHDNVGNSTVEGQRQQRADDLFDMVATTGSAFLGLTVGCARCHDHKFDPVLQKDFYALQALVAGVRHAGRPIAAASGADQVARASAVRARLERIDRQLDEAEPQVGQGKRPGVLPGRNVERFAACKARFVRFVVRSTTDRSEPCIDELEVFGPGGPGNLALAALGVKTLASSTYPNNPIHRLEHLNDGRYGNGRSWISAEPGKGWVRLELPRVSRIDRVVWGRDREGRYRDRLALDYVIEVSLDGKQWSAVAVSADRLPPGEPLPGKQKQTLLDEQKSLREELARLTAPVTVYAGTFGTPDVVHRLHRGEVMQRREVVAPGGIAALRLPLAVRGADTDAARRLALAEWISHPDNPLPDRVMVNRLWQGHFGQGIVRTSSDFGFNGDRPSHPELLDWLASEFRAAGGRMKPVHRLIVLSSAYRQQSRLVPAAAKVDAGNRLLWRMQPRRLEAEAIRDSMLAAAGSLERRMGGPGYDLWNYSNYVTVFEQRPNLGPETFRRMVYQFKPRLQQDRTFGAFDCPDATTTMPRRNVSTTALQALNLLNDPFVRDQAGRFAERLRREAGPDVPRQVRLAFRLALGRSPGAREQSGGEQLVEGHGLASLCRALFNANEFVYVP